MPLNKLDNFIKNTEGRILYVSPADLDSTDSILNQGNSLARPFKTIQRALIESARFSYVGGDNNDHTERTTILLMPGDHILDNRPSRHIIKDSNGAAKYGDINTDLPTFNLDSNFDLTQSSNDLAKFNSTEGGVIVPRGTSIVGLDLRKTKIRPLYVPNPINDDIGNSAIFRITGACYFWQFSIFDGLETSGVYVNPNGVEQAKPTFSHHKLTCFEYADGVNTIGDDGLTDLDMYYAKVSIAYGDSVTNSILANDRYPGNTSGFAKQRPEWEIVGAFAPDPLEISGIESGSAGNPSPRITVTTKLEHNLNVGTPIRISNVTDSRYNTSTKVTKIVNSTTFEYTLSIKNSELISINTGNTEAQLANLLSGENQPGPASVIIETDTVSGASPYIFNISLRSVWGMNGMWADGSKADGFRSMVVAQFTGVSLQKDDRAFVKYNSSDRSYSTYINYGEDSSELADLSSQSSNPDLPLHLDSGAIYRKGWETAHIKLTNDAILQIVSVFAIGYNKHFEAQSGGDASITNSNSNFGQLSLISDGFKDEAFGKDNKAYVTSIIGPKAVLDKEEPVDWLTIDLEKTNLGTTNAEKLYLFGFNDDNVPPPILTQGFRVGAKFNDKLYFKNDTTGEGYATILMAESESAVSQFSGRKEMKIVPHGTKDNTFITQDADGVDTAHNFVTGEKVIIISDDGDYPENIETNTVYFIIKDTTEESDEFRLASSESEANANDQITVSGGTNLSVISRVTDKFPGEKGHPIHFDEGENAWFMHVDNSGSDPIDLSGLGNTGATEPTYIKRVSDSRSLDDKIYKLRVVVPKEIPNAKNPESGFIIQESSSTDVSSDADPGKTTLEKKDYDYNKNNRFISNIDHNGLGDEFAKVTVTTERPHNLKVGESVKIKGVRSYKDSNTNNYSGIYGQGYNGKYTVSDVDNAFSFKYKEPIDPGNFLRSRRTFVDTNVNITPTLSESNGVFSILGIHDRYNSTDNTSLYEEGDYISGGNIANDVFIVSKTATGTTGGDNLDLYNLELSKDPRINSSGSNCSSLPSTTCIGPIAIGTPYDRTTSSARFERSDDTDSVYSYRNEVLQEYNYPADDGIYYTYPSNSSNSVTEEFTNLSYSQNIVDLYPQIDRDNVNDNPLASRSFASRSPLGKVVTSDLQKSLTKESLDKFIRRHVGGLDVDSFDNLTNIVTFSSDTPHNLSGVTKITVSSGQEASGTTIGKLYNVELTAANGTGCMIDCELVDDSGTVKIKDGSIKIVRGGLGYTATNTLNFNYNGTQYDLTATNVGIVEGLAIQFTGSTVHPDTYFRVDTISSELGLLVNRPTGGDQIYSDQYGIIIGVSFPFTNSGVVSGNTITFNIGSHNLKAGQKVQIKKHDHTDIGSYIVKSTTSGTVTFDVSGSSDPIKTTHSGTNYGYVIRHGLSSNDKFTNKTKEEIGVRGMTPFGGDVIQLTASIDVGASSIDTHAYGTTSEVDPDIFNTVYPLGTFLQIDDEIVRISGPRSSVSGATRFNITRGMLGTKIAAHSANSLVVKIAPIPIEFRRPSILRASGHTFEYLGYGPGNYSTGLPQVQDRTLTEKEEFLSQSQERGAGIVVYTGMNNKGDFYIGNQKKSSATGEETTFDTPIATVAGEDPSRLSAVFDEVTVKERIVVEGGNSNQILSQFNGPVTFSEKTRFKNTSTFIQEVNFDNSSAEIDYSVNFKGTTIVKGNDGFFRFEDNNELRFGTNDDLVIKHIDNNNGSDNSIQSVINDLKIKGNAAHSNDISIERDDGDQLAKFDMDGGVELNWRGSTTPGVKLKTVATGVEITGTAAADGQLYVKGDITAFHSSDMRLKENIQPIENAIAKIITVSGNTFDWKENSGHEGPDTGVIAQEIESLGLPGVVTTRDDGYKAVRYERLVPLLIEAIKELNEKVDSLEQRLNN